MSIYATLWTLKFPSEGDATCDCEWITVHAQAVPPHIGTPTPGHGYEQGDPYREFLPPPVEVDAHGTAPYDRAVVFVTERSIRGTERHPQEYTGRSQPVWRVRTRIGSRLGRSSWRGCGSCAGSCLHVASLRA